MIRKLLFVVLLAMIFSAIAVSASQLRKSPTSAMACGNPCGSNLDCARPKCLCLFLLDGGPGTCVAPGAASRSH